RLRAFDRLSQTAFPKSHPYHAPTKDEMLASLVAAKAPDLRAFHKARYVGSGMYLAVVGDVDPEAIASEVEALLGGLPQGTAPSLDLPRVARGAPAHEGGGG